MCSPLFKHTRKGNAVLDTMTIFLVMIVLAIASIFGYQAFTEINDDLQNDTDIGNFTKNVSGNLHSIYPSLLDNIFLFAFVLIVIGVIISVFLLDTHPILLFVSVILLISVFVAMLLVSNTYDELMSDSEISVYANQFPYTTWLMTHFLELSIAVGFILLITLFAKVKT